MNVLIKNNSKPNYFESQPLILNDVDIMDQKKGKPCLELQVKSCVNLADLFTKSLPAVTLRKYV
jgi:hypothetical protein